MSVARERWNERHERALAGAPRRDEPSSWIAEHAAALAAQPSGAALDVACGLGRDALFLAALGFEVDAVDVSDVALAEVARRARAHGLAVRTHRLELPRDPLPGGAYRVIVCVSFLERELLPALAGALAPGGLLLYDTFLPDPGAAHGPQDPAFVLRPGELRAAFAGLRVLAYAEGPPAAGERARARLAALAPG